ncbi:hypothetical protein [Microtetraspora sp. NBRC 16547]|uniref:hypothetical protein n=1 Tax=Microtetraspora sp. NBRC 16547 TaxID=3030993 RepID=UPI00249FD07F|nr:hypothetical protein [Microtetraspora sp. NBRC 16547]GLW96153.1 hypothetical protein Misp02_02400 [Microtetraspora sp. NBRC 16547]
MGKHAGAPAVEAIGNLKRVQILAGMGLLTLTLVENMLIDDEAIIHAANNWLAVARELDGGPKRMLALMLAESRDTWIADDQTAFEDAVVTFQSKLEVLRGMVTDTGGLLDEIGATFRDFGWAMFVFSGTLLATTASAAVLRFTPAGAQAQLFMRVLIQTADKILAAWGKALLAYLGGAAFILGYLWRKEMQMRNVEPTGVAAIDFKKATINVDRNPTFSKPGKPGTLPPSTAGFDWIAPKRDVPLPYGQ